MSKMKVYTTEQYIPLLLQLLFVTIYPDVWVREILRTTYMNVDITGGSVRAPPKTTQEIKWTKRVRTCGIRILNQKKIQVRAGNLT